MRNQLVGILGFFLLPLLAVFAMALSSSNTGAFTLFLLPPLTYFGYLTVQYKSLKIPLQLAMPRAVVRGFLLFVCRFRIPFIWLRQVLFALYFRHCQISTADVQVLSAQFAGCSSFATLRNRRAEPARRLSGQFQQQAKQADQNCVATVTAPCDADLVYFGDFSQTTIENALPALQCTPAQLIHFSRLDQHLQELLSQQKFGFALFSVPPGCSARLHAPFAFQLTQVIQIPGDFFFVTSEGLEKLPRLLVRLKRVVALGWAWQKLCAIVIFGDCELFGQTFAENREKVVFIQQDIQQNQEIGSFVLGTCVMAVLELDVCRNLTAALRRTPACSEALSVQDAHE